MSSLRKELSLLMIGPLEAEVIGVLYRLGKAPATKIWEQLVGKGRKISYTTLLTVLSRLCTRGFIRKREITENTSKYVVYELTIDDELKREIVQKHINVIIKMFGKDGIKLIKDIIHEVEREGVE